MRLSVYFNGFTLSAKFNIFTKKCFKILGWSLVVNQASIYEKAFIVDHYERKTLVSSSIARNYKASTAIISLFIVIFFN